MYFAGRFGRCLTGLSLLFAWSTRNHVRLDECPIIRERGVGDH